MIAVIDKNKRYKENKKILVLSILVLILVSAISISGITLLMIFSPENYTWNMVGVILISFVYLSFLFSFFFYYFKPIYKRYNFFLRLKRSTYQEGYFKLIKVEDNIVKHGLIYKNLLVSYLYDGKSYQRNLYLFENDVYAIKVGDEFKARYFSNVLIGYEVIENA